MFGIAPTAPAIEKIKNESAEYLYGLNSCAIIDWETYSEMFDFYENLLDEAYQQGILDCKNYRK